MLFQIRTSLEGGNLKETVKLLTKTGPFQKDIRCLRTLWVSLGTGSVFFAGLILLAFGRNVIFFICALVGIGLLVFGIFGSLFRWLIAQFAGKARLGERLYTYYEDHIESLRDDTVTSISYETVSRVLLHHGIFYLIIEMESVFFLMHPKEDFVAGDSDGFAAFIMEKTGKPVEYIK